MRFLKDWHRAFHPHVLGLGSNLSPSPMFSWANPKQSSIINLGLVPQLKPNSKDISGQAQGTHYQHDKPGPFIWSSPLRPKSILISLWAFHHMLFFLTSGDDDGGNGGERGIAGGPRSWSRLPTLHAALLRHAAPSAVERA